MSKYDYPGTEAVPPASTNKKDVDAAWNFLNEHHGGDIETSSMDLKAIRRKIDWRIVPLMFACYTMQFLDKVILNVRTRLLKSY